MESIKKVITYAKKKAQERKNMYAMADKWKKEQAMKKKILESEKKTTLGSKPKTHGNLFEAIKHRKNLPLKIVDNIK